MKLLAWLEAHPWLRTALAGLAGGLLGYAGGRWSAPTRVQVVEHTEFVDQWHVVKDTKTVEVEGPIRWKTRRIITPGPPGACGPTVVIEREVEKGPSTTTTDTTTESEGTSHGTVERERLVEREAPRVTLLGTVGLDVGNLAAPPVWGGQVQARVLGPLVLGLGFDSSLRATAVAGVTF